MMDDIDILVPGDRAVECWRLLTSLGWMTAPECRDWDVAGMPFQQWPQLLHPRHIGVLEMHHVNEWPHMMGAIDWNRGAELCTVRGGRARVLSATNRMIFSLAHGYVHHASYFRAVVPLRDLYDAALLSATAGAEIAWPEVIAAFDQAGETAAFRAACWIGLRLGQDLPCSPGPPPRAAIYWQRCLLNIANPEMVRLQELLGINFGSLRRALGRSAEGERIRREFTRPSVVFRKFRSAVRVCRPALLRRNRGGS
jgi:hypothetical protein